MKNSITNHEMPENIGDRLEADNSESGCMSLFQPNQNVESMPEGRVRSGAEILELANRLFAKYGDVELGLSRNYTERPPVEFDDHTTG